MSEKILAVAAGHEITEKELQELISNYPMEQQLYLSNPQARQEVLEQLIAFHLFAKLAEEKEITKTKEYQETIEKMKVELASHMAATRCIEEAAVTDAEVEAFYEENKTQFSAKPAVRAKHILVETEEKAKEIMTELADGKEFEAAAKEHSTCPSGEQGGDLGFFEKGQMVPEFEKAAFDGPVGEVIGPVQTQFGYHLILVTDKREGSIRPFESIKDQLTQQLLNNKQREVYEKTVSELEAKYGVTRN